MNFFREGGTTMWVILLLAPGALAMSITHAAMARRWSAWVAVGVVGLVLLVGGLGTMRGRSQTEQAAGSIENVGERVELVAMGYAESARNYQFAIAVAGACAIPIMVGQVRRMARKTG